MLAPGSDFDNKYRIISVLGVGSFGAVYKAEQIELSRIVAIKILKNDFVVEPESQERFKREARLLCELTHPNIVKILSSGFDQAVPYFVMEYLEGLTLDAALRKVPAIQNEQMLAIFEQVCDGMAAANKFGIVHRDLKPANVFLQGANDNFQVKILDFGLSKTLESSKNVVETLTKTGAILGTVEYMSPEACSGTAVDIRSDIYAVGCMLYESLAGRRPFEAENAIAILHKHLSEPTPSLPRNIEETSPKGIQLVIAKAMQKEQNQRFQSFEQFKTALSAVRNHDVNQIDQLLALEPKRSTKPNNSVFIGAGVATICIAGTLLGVGHVRNSKRENHEPQQKSFIVRVKKPGLMKELQKIDDLELLYHSEISLLQKHDSVEKVGKLLHKLEGLESLLNDQQSKFYFHWVKGKCYADLGQRDKAISEIKKALIYCSSTKDVKYSEEPIILRFLASFELAAGHDAEARKFAQAAIDCGDDFAKWLDAGKELTPVIHTPGVDIPGWEEAIAMAREIMIKLAIKRGDYKEGVKQGELAIDYAIKTDTADGAVAIFLQYADCQIKLNHRDVAIAKLKYLQLKIPKIGELTASADEPDRRRALAAHFVRTYDLLAKWLAENNEPEMAAKCDAGSSSLAKYYQVEYTRDKAYHRAHE